MLLGECWVSLRHRIQSTPQIQQAGARPNLLEIRDDIDQRIFAPIHTIEPTFHIPVKTRIRPFFRGKRQAMFHWIVMNVLHVPHEIEVVSYQMLPEHALPNHDLTFFLSRRYGCLFVFLSKMPAEIFFDQTYAY